MRALKLLLVAAMATGLSFAATWDGTRGNLTLLTTSYNTGMPGLIVMPNPATYTVFWITTTDPSTTSFRVTVKYRTGDGGDAAIAVGFCDRAVEPASASAAFFRLDPALVLSVAIEELRASPPVEFFGSK